MGKILRFTRRPAWNRRRYLRRKHATVSPKAVRRVPFWIVLCVVMPAFAIIGALAPAPKQTLSSVSSERPGVAVPTSAAVLTGRASIVDGDTFVINGQEVRLSGIDAPESSQRCTNKKGESYRCGRVAAEALDGFLAASRPTTCQFVEWDQYRRFVGECTRADGTSVAVWLVRNGHAMDWPRHSRGAYDQDQAAARADRIGIWQGQVQPPWEYRADKRSGTATTTAAPQPLLSGTCDIKGNISNQGERIYHVPGQRYYGKTRIDRSKGERMFCSEAEARQAGWRRSKV
jgi:endonuclease YncB( thermonuclease family)